MFQRMMAGPFDLWPVAVLALEQNTVVEMAGRIGRNFKLCPPIATKHNRTKSQMLSQSQSIAANDDRVTPRSTLSNIDS